MVQFGSSFHALVMRLDLVSCEKTSLLSQFPVVVQWKTRTSSPESDMADNAENHRRRVRGLKPGRPAAM